MRSWGFPINPNGLGQARLLVGLFFTDGRSSSGLAVTDIAVNPGYGHTCDIDRLGMKHDRALVQNNPPADLAHDLGQNRLNGAKKLVGQLFPVPFQIQRAAIAVLADLLNLGIEGICEDRENQLRTFPPAARSVPALPPPTRLQADGCAQPAPRAPPGVRPACDGQGRSLKTGDPDPAPRSRCARHRDLVTWREGPPCTSVQELQHAARSHSEVRSDREVEVTLDIAGLFLERLGKVHSDRTEG